jgi:hypothetical protein
MKPNAARILSMAVLAIAVAGCAYHEPTRGASLPGSHMLQVNGRAVNVPHAISLHEALLRTTASSIVGGRVTTQGPPLYVMDGVPLLDGLGIVRSMRVCEAASVVVLRGPDAVTRYGGRAGAGAVVIVTRRGDTPGSC